VRLSPAGPLLAVAALLLAAAPASACCERAHLLPEGEQPGQVPLAIGDSVMLGAAEPLAHAGLEVDAKEGRVMHAAVSILRRRARVQTLPDTVVVALGTNIPAQPAEVADAIRILGRERTLVLVIPLRGWMSFGGAAFWRAKRLHPKTVRVLDWATAASSKAGWLYGDGTHLRPQGALAYARLVRRVVHPVTGARSGGAPTGSAGAAQPSTTTSSR
jgi:hypothetical protein